MDKDEILEKSRRENINGDEWQKDTVCKGYRFALFGGVILLGAFCLIKKDISYLIIMFAMNLFRSVYMASKFKRIVDFVLVAVEVVLCAVLIYNYVNGIL